MLPTPSSSRSTRLASHDAPGYSRSYASASGGRAEVAPVCGAPPLWRGVDEGSSGIDSELDPGRPGDAGAGHGLAQLVAAGERLGLLERGEPVQDDHVLLVSRVDQHLGAEAAVPLPELRHAVVHRPPGDVV